MNTELILLIVSLFSNAVIILKKIRVIWTPCLIISCVNEIEEETNNTSSETNFTKFKKVLSRIIYQIFQMQQTKKLINLLL